MTNQSMHNASIIRGDIDHLNSSQHTIHNKKVWIGLSVAASICFTICNSAIVEVSATMGPFTMFYYVSGGIFSGVVFNISRFYINYKKNGIFWVNQNIIINGSIKWGNFIGFVTFCCVFFIVQNSLLLAIYFAGAANLNAGLITSIWSICPFFIAITDYFLFG